MRKFRSALNNALSKLTDKRTLGRPRCRWKERINEYQRNVVGVGMKKLIVSAQSRIIGELL